MPLGKKSWKPDCAMNMRTLRPILVFTDKMVKLKFNLCRFTYHFWSIPKTGRIQTTLQINLWLQQAAFSLHQTQTFQKYPNPNGKRKRDQKRLLCLGMKITSSLRLIILNSSCASWPEFSGENRCSEAYRTGRDIHATTAAKIFQGATRRRNYWHAKKKPQNSYLESSMHFSFLDFRKRLEHPKRRSQGNHRRLFQGIPAFKEYMDGSDHQGAKRRNYVETIRAVAAATLRGYHKPKLNMRGFAERNAIQRTHPRIGCGGIWSKSPWFNGPWMDLKKEKLKSKMILQGPDELVFDAH